MTWIAEMLRAHPELALLATLAAGYSLSKVKLGPLRINTVIAVLLAGLFIGQLDVDVPAALQSTLLALFVFAVGYETGPQFFQGLRANGLTQIGLTVVFWLVALALVLALTAVFGLSPAESAGIFAGGITESSALGTADGAIGRLEIDATLRQQLSTELTVAFAVSYVVGLASTIWVLSWVGPRLMRTDLAAECRKLEAELGVDSTEVGVFSAYRAFVTRAYRIPGSLAGHTVAALERQFAPQRAFVQRLRRGTTLGSVEPDTVLAAGDRIALTTRHESLVSERNSLRAAEIDDPELLDIPSIEVAVLLTRKEFVGRPLAEISELASRDVTTRGVFVRKITRGKQELPRAQGTVLERGDVLSLTGAKEDIERLASRIGFVEWPSDSSDLGPVTATIVIGGLIGLMSVSVGGFQLDLGVAVGVLLGGLLLGWLRSLYPLMGRVTPGGLWMLDSLGLTGFLACVALNSAPMFVDGLRESGAMFIASGFALATVPHMLTILVGRYVFGIHPGLLLGIVCGAATSAPALAAVQQAAQSKVPALAYGVSYAVGNVVLALSGSIIVTVLAG